MVFDFIKRIIEKFYALFRRKKEVKPAQRVEVRKEEKKPVIEDEKEDPKLAKKIGNKYLSFHRWLMNDLGKVDDEAIRRGCSPNDLVVHHRNHNHQDNRIKKLPKISLCQELQIPEHYQELRS